MFDGSFSLAAMVFASVAAGLEEPRPGRMMLNGRYPFYGLYRTRDGRHMSLGAVEFKFWRNFCQAVGRPDLEAEQFGGPEAVAEVESIFAEKTQAEWIGFLRDADACCEPVLYLDEAADSDQCRKRGLVNIGPDGRRCLAAPFLLSASPRMADSPAPSLGQHNAEILGELGLSEKEIPDLEKLEG